MPEARETQPPPALLLVWADGVVGVTCSEDGGKWWVVPRREDGSVEREGEPVGERHASLEALATAVVGATATPWSPPHED